MVVRKKLIDVALSLEATNREAAREKSDDIHAHSGEFHRRSVRRFQAVLFPTENDG
jgi:hypothetical protein